jgi:hypothetical protein
VQVKVSNEELIRGRQEVGKFLSSMSSDQLTPKLSTSIHYKTTNFYSKFILEIFA